MERKPYKKTCTMCQYKIGMQMYYELRSFRFCRNIKVQFCTLRCVAKWITEGYMIDHIHNQAAKE